MQVVQQVAGVKTLMGLQDGALVTGTEQDCTAIHEDAQARHNAGAHGSKDMRHAARLPLVVVEQYCNRRGITFEQWANEPVHIRAMLADPDLSGFRIWGGAL